MTKPDGIPKDIWQSAFDAHQMILNTSIPTEAGAILRIARAIVAEREACAQIADCDCSNPGCDRQEIADAIRNRSES